ncbi:MAG: redoxin domain-containing protein [Gemmataceae bacterium]
MSLIVAEESSSNETAQEQGENASRAKLGKKIPNLVFQTAAGKKRKLYDLKDHKAIVIAFLSFECPVSKSYSRPLAKLFLKYKESGVAVLGIVPHPDKNQRQVEKDAKPFELPFPVYHDHGFRYANAFEADYTPEVFVLDGNFVVRYRGRIDDSYYARLKRNPKVTSHDLLKAVDEVVAGRPVSHPATKPIGCLIFRGDQKLAKKGPVTYHRDVLPILQKRCQGCHRPGEVGPFSLMTYRQAVNWAADIKTFTQNRYMPPWKATSGMKFHDERKMPKKEIALLAKWVDTGTPEGNPKDAPPPVEFPKGWQLGDPDMVMQMPSAWQLGPDGPDVFRCFVFPTKFSEDKYCSAVELRPSNRAIVHHILLFVDTKGRGRRRQVRAQARERARPSRYDDKGPGYSVPAGSSGIGVGVIPEGNLGGWAPGVIPRYFPKGAGFYLPKGADIVMQVHYHRNGRLEKDRTRIGLHFSKNKKCRPIQAFPLPGGTKAPGLYRIFFTIPPNKKRFPLGGSAWAMEDCELYSITPHMHMLGKEMYVTMTTPDGKTKTIIGIDDWDYQWQEEYRFKKPLKIKRGTKLTVKAYYDNTADNPLNPFSPPRTVTFGDETTNEMCFAFLGGSSNRGGPLLPFSLHRVSVKDNQTKSN